MLVNEKSSSADKKTEEVPRKKLKVKKIIRKRKKLDDIESPALKIAHTKVDPTVNAAKERRHVQEATRGVVQLFNAVRQRHEFLEQKIEVLEKGSRAERRKALEQIRLEIRGAGKLASQKQAKAKIPKTEVDDDDDYNSEGVSDGEVIEVKKEEELSDDETDSSDDNEEDSNDDEDDE